MAKLDVHQINNESFQSLVFKIKILKNVFLNSFEYFAVFKNSFENTKHSVNVQEANFWNVIKLRQRYLVEERTMRQTWFNQILQYG